MNELRGWLLLLFPALPIAYFAFVRRSLRIDLDGFRIYKGLIRGGKHDFRSVNAIQLERRRFRQSVYYRLFIEMDGRLICGGDEEDFSSLKLTLERHCKVAMEDETAVAKFSIDSEYGIYLAPIGRKYYCIWENAPP
jgi:hypothetical protein